MLTKPVKNKPEHQILLIKHLFFPHVLPCSSVSPHIAPQEKRGVMNAAGHQLLLTCLETLQRALKGETVNPWDRNSIFHYNTLLSILRQGRVTVFRLKLSQMPVVLTSCFRGNNKQLYQQDNGQVFSSILHVGMLCLWTVGILASCFVIWLQHVILGFLIILCLLFSLLSALHDWPSRIHRSTKHVSSFPFAHVFSSSNQVHDWQRRQL